MGSPVACVYGIGSPHGDDRLGWQVADALRQRVPPGVLVEVAADPLALLEVPIGCRLLIVVDACHWGGEPGTIRRLVWPDAQLDPNRLVSSHAWGVREALLLAERLGRLPPHVVVLAVEVSPDRSGATMSEPVARAVPELVRRVLAEVSRTEERDMTEPVTPEAVRGLAFFSPLTDAEAVRLAGAARWEVHLAGTILFREGEVHRSIGVVASGEVAIEIVGADRRPRRLQTVGRGELLGWSPVLGHGRMTATARTLTDVRLLTIAADTVLALCDADPHFGYQFMRRVAAAIASRLQATRLQLLDMFRAELPAVEAGGGVSWRPGS